MRLEFRILGPLEVRREARPLTLGGRRERVLLALLVLDCNRVVSSERIIDALWGAEPPPTAATSVHVAVSRLRKVLGAEGADVLVTRPGGYLLRLEPGQLDADRFERLVESGRAALAEGRADVAAQRLSEATDLWRGVPLADLRYEAFAQHQIARLEELRLIAIEEATEAGLALGRHAALVAELEALIREHPLRERLRAQLMLALYRCGRQAEALQAYRDARTSLVEELGIEASADLRDLQRAILNQDAALVPPARGEPSKTNLPAPPTPLVGRQHELRSVIEALRRPDVRLVTLTGAPGTGKTRLALEAAIVLADEFDRVAFVGLAPIADPQLVVYEIARTLGVAEDANTPILELIEAGVRDSRVLLLLDNCEHVLLAADDVAQLLAVGPTLHVLATSREALRLSGEHELDIPPLALADLARTTEPASIARSEAVSLFMQRAQAVKPTFALTVDNALDVARLCARLDGLPLAIELAAARVRTLTPQSLLAQLDRPLSVLTRGARDLPDRQKTLRAAFEWSYRLLDPNDATLLNSLSVFAGGCTAASAEAICDPDGDLDGDVVDGLASLVEKSLLRWVEGAGQPRFTMLETIRQYALERLDQTGRGEQLRSAHARHFLELAEAAYRGRLADERGCAERLEREHDNLRRALEWFAVHAPARRLQLAGALAWFWAAHSHLHEGRQHLADVVESAPEQGAHLARALVGLGQLEVWQGETAAATERMEGAAALWAQVGDPLERAITLDALSYARWASGDLRGAQQTAQESLARARELQRPDLATSARLILSLTLLTQGDVAHAEPLAREALAAALNEGDVRREQQARHLLGDCALLREQFEPARASYAEAARVAWQLGDRAQTAVDVQGTAMATAGCGEPLTALRLGGAAAAALQDLGVDVDVAFWVALVERHLNRTKRELGPAGDAAWDEGRRMRLEQALDSYLKKTTAVTAVAAHGHDKHAR